MCRVSFLLLFFWNIVLFAFSQEVNIQIKKALEHSRPVKLSEIASEQSFITLDYVSDLENDEDVFTYLLEDRIICIGKSICVFDRNGKLLDLVKFPNTEWFSNYRDNCRISLLNEREGALLIPLKPFKEYPTDPVIREYNIDNISTYKMFDPLYKRKERDWYIGNLSTGEYVFKGENFFGNDTIEFFLCSKDSVLQQISNPSLFNQEKTTLALRTGSYYYENQLYVYEDGDDFIYQLTKEGKKKVYQLGCDELKQNNELYLKAVHHSIWTGNKKVVNAVLKKYISSLFFIECENYLLFSFSYNNSNYLGYYSKKKKETVIAELAGNRKSLFENDLTRKTHFCSTRWYINTKGELGTLLSPADSKLLSEPFWDWRSWFPWLFDKKKRGRSVIILKMR